MDHLGRDYDHRLRGLDEDGEAEIGLWESSCARVCVCVCVCVSVDVWACVWGREGTVQRAMMVETRRENFIKSLGHNSSTHIVLQAQRE